MKRGSDTALAPIVRRVHAQAATALALCLALLVLAGCMAGTPSSRLRKMGFVASFSGYDSTTAPAMLAAIRQSVDRYNRDVDSQNIVEIVALDDANTGTVGEAKARELVADSAVIAAISAAHGNASLQAYRDAGLPLLSIGGPSIGGSGVVSLCAGARDEGEQAGRYARSIGATRIAVVDAVGEGFQVAASSFVASVASPVARLTFDPANWRGNRVLSKAVVADLATKDVDFVYYSGPYDLAERLVPLAKSGIVLAGSDSDTPAFERLVSFDGAPFRRVATCAGDATAPAGPHDGPQRAARRAALAAQSILDVIEANDSIVVDRSTMAAQLEERVAKLDAQSGAVAERVTVY